ncbi:MULTISPECIES: M23 family metallopeptidase [unclassified Pseudoalteromonas]|uniref:M23 family metallopeptidase n=1 Tax=unclassified Pseudoalteromonas TaxID=194690 RepID=UPI0005A75D02|nr:MULTISPECIES: M23 family metallopeptidase [unclassified Pseudoalteromonas]
MLSPLKKIYKHYLPERQLLIRQNGEVKYLNITGVVQLSLLSIITITFIWFVYSSKQYFALNQKISSSHNNLQQSKQDLDQLTNQYKEKHQTLNKQLTQLQEQQVFLQNILESLPSAISPEKEGNITPTEHQVDTQAPSNESISLLDKMDISHKQLSNIRLKQHNDLTQLAKQVQHRQNILDKALNNAGITNEMIKSHFVNSTIAQGGPLYDLSTKATDKQKNVIDQLIELKELELALQNVPVKLPAKDYYISSLYGYRKDPITKRRSMHKGIDMAGWIKTQIFSPAKGTVKRAGKNGSYGNFIEIDHLNGFSTRYGHLHKIKVKKGQTVSKNDVIGLMGSTGRSTSTHLHYELMFNNKTVNPLKITKALENVL